MRNTCKKSVFDTFSKLSKNAWDYIECIHLSLYFTIVLEQILQYGLD